MMMDGTANSGSVVPASAAFNVHQQLSEASRIFQQNSYQAAAAAGTMSPFGGHMGGHQLQHHQHPSHAVAAAAAAANHHQLGHHGQQQQHHQHNHNAAVAAAAAISAMGGNAHGGMGQLAHGLSGASQTIAAALFANSPHISEDLKLAAAAAAAAAAAQTARGKKTHRAEPVPQSGFKGVSWNSRMKAWLAFYVTENGERKSKTFSTRKLGMEEARLQAIAFCKQKQDQRREARKRNRELQSQHCNGLDKLSSDESMMESPASSLGHLHQDGQATPRTAGSSAHQGSLRCGYPTTPGMGGLMGQGQAQQTPQSAIAAVAQTSTNGSEIAYVPIVPIAMDMIEKSGLLQPLELNVLPPCQHCNKQPYPFLMIVSEGQEQSYSGSSIMSLASQSAGGVVPQSVDVSQPVVPDVHGLNSDVSNQQNASVPSQTAGEDEVADIKSEGKAPQGDHSAGNSRSPYGVLESNGQTDQNVSCPSDDHAAFRQLSRLASPEDLKRLTQLVEQHRQQQHESQENNNNGDLSSPSSTSSDPPNFSPSAMMSMSESQFASSTLVVGMSQSDTSRENDTQKNLRHLVNYEELVNQQQRNDDTIIDSM